MFQLWNAYVLGIDSLRQPAILLQTNIDVDYEMDEINGPNIITVLLYIGANLESYLRFIASLRLCVSISMSIKMVQKLNMFCSLSWYTHTHIVKHPNCWTFRLKIQDPFIPKIDFKTSRSDWYWYKIKSPQTLSSSPIKWVFHDKIRMERRHGRFVR